MEDCKDRLGKAADLAYAFLLVRLKERRRLAPSFPPVVILPLAQKRIPVPMLPSSLLTVDFVPFSPFLLLGA